MLRRTHVVKAFASGIIVASSRVIVFSLISISVAFRYEFLGAETLFPAVALLYVLQNTMLKRMYICTQHLAEGLTSIARVQVLYPKYSTFSAVVL